MSGFHAILQVDGLTDADKNYTDAKSSCCRPMSCMTNQIYNETELSRGHGW